MPKTLSQRSRIVLRLIADGNSYAQIVDGNPDITYLDIFNAAREALELDDESSEWDSRMADIKAKHPRAYEKWEEVEETELRSLVADGKSVEELVEHFGRQPGAIASRMRRLGLEAGNKA